MLLALMTLLIMHARFWTLTQPVNRVWLRDQTLGRAGTDVVGTGRQTGPNRQWTSLRNRWEYSHVARAFCAMLCLILLAAGATASALF